MFDWLFFFSAIAFYLFIIGVFISVKKKREKLAKKFGALTVLLAIPWALVFINYLIIGKQLWIIIIMVIIFAYLFIELLLDIILKIDFRTDWKRHVPYIILFYVVSFGIIGISFSIDAILGWIVTIAFWAELGAVIYSYSGKKK